MTDTELDQALESIGLQPDDLDPAVYESLRQARQERTRQLTREDLASMTPAQIVEAKSDGRLDQLLRKGS